MFGPAILYYFVTLDAIEPGYVTIDLETGKLRNGYRGEPLIGYTQEPLPANTLVGKIDGGRFIVIPPAEEE